MRDLAGRRLLLLNVFAGPSIGGGEVVLLELARACGDLGMHVGLVCVPGAEVGRRAAERGIDVIELDLRPAAALAHWTRVRAAVATFSPDVVQGTGFLTNVLARFVAPRGSLVVNTVQVVPGAARAGAGGLLRRVLERFGRARVSSFIAVSEAVRDALVSGGIALDRVRVLYPGIDVDALSRGASGPLPEGFPAARPVVGVLARLERVKGVEVFLRAAPLVAAEVPEAAFVVCGSGSEHARLAPLAAEAQVALLGDAPSAAAYLAHLDVAVVPSRSEAFGLAAAEAMALGTPVVASAVGGLAEIVLHGESGVLVAPGDERALADAVLGLLRDPARAARLAEAGRARVAERFGRAAADAATERFYRDLLGTTGGAA